MSTAFERTIEDVDNTIFESVRDGFKRFDDLSKNTLGVIAKLRLVVEDFKKTGNLPDIDELNRKFQVSPQKQKGETCTSHRNSLKENIEPDEPARGASPPRTRPRRNAFKEAAQNINEQTNASLSSKQRRPRNLQDPFQNIYVKVEKLSINCAEAPQEEAPLDVKVKTEGEEMPAPAKPAPKKKKRKETKVKVKQEKVEEDSKVRDSDVVVQDATVTVVDLVSDDEQEKTVVNEEEKGGEMPKGRTKSKKTKRSRTGSPGEESKEKRSKSSDEKEEAKDLGDATFVAKPQESVNTTVVVENPKIQNLPKSLNDLMTDDESEEEVKKKVPPKPSRAIPKPTKQIFSPFEQSPVKKKVEAFEKLNEASALPTRVTRTKTKARAKEQEEADEEPKSIVKEKAKMFTPLATNKFLPKAASTSTKPQKSIDHSATNESLLSAKSASALKASQAEYREREKRRREKEQEAIKKREALLQAQIEEKKRKREEKQLKAQQQREALEKEKLKALEHQRLKDERHRQLVAEQEEKKQKMKEEVEKKRKLAKMRAIEEKKREEEKQRREEHAKLKREAETKQKQLPVYMKTRTPLLPTEDCYDSDDERAAEKIFIPEWNKERRLKYAQMLSSLVGETLKNTFFSVQAQTPDLQDIFEVIEPQKLKRNSSAVWHKPPRFTMMPALEKHDETEEFDDCLDY